MVHASRERTAAHPRGTWRGTASRQETSVQNSNPSRNPIPSPSLLQTLLEHTFLGARPSANAAPTSGDIPHADAARSADLADVDTDVDTDATDTGESVGRLELAELLGVLRDPIEWVFTLAERRALGDPVDIAATHRVRDAVLHRVNAIIVGAPWAEPPRIRPADLWTVSGLLIDTLDPSLVQGVMRGVGTRIADVLAAGLQFEPSLVAHLGRAAAAFTGPDGPPPVAPSWYAGAVPAQPVAPFRYGAATPYVVGPHGVPCPGAFAAPHLLRPAVPPWCCPHAPLSF
jgi:hypothetical protein